MVRNAKHMPEAIAAAARVGGVRAGGLGGSNLPFDAEPCERRYQGSALVDFSASIELDPT